jgi:hypothetical protein
MYEEDELHCSGISFAATCHNHCEDVALLSGWNRPIRRPLGLRDGQAIGGKGIDQSPAPLWFT